jgi:hypothetical protein
MVLSAMVSSVMVLGPASCRARLPIELKKNRASAKSSDAWGARLVVAFSRTLSAAGAPSVSEILSVSETLSFSATRLLSETLSFADTLPVSGALALSDVCAGAAASTGADGASFVDQISAAESRALAPLRSAPAVDGVLF